ncbi:hypothetical protein NRIC_05210 [Enterococcus florum]|uniref:Gram-positive cocci surface proteins LPxTG domain-containing protein n=1 Tax=Enterococcus florum TaxID=2480627 RepID=A0A4P5P4P9_9ENTE|nr:PepSY-like domain-containing protein [Enterococcus florum]GCF92630.1 hypothetical protein NRIC_05210 [Enterococcus florum]
MKKIAVFLMLFSLGFAQASPIYAETLDTPNAEAPADLITVPMKLKDFPKNMSLNTTKTLAFEDFEGIKLTGTFKAFKNDQIELNEDGELKALAVGTTEFTPEFTLSSEAVDAIKAKYPGKEIAYTDIEKVTLTVKTELSVPLIPEPEKITAKVGEQGKLAIAAFEGVELTGTFAEIKNNEYIKLAKDGSWEALKATKEKIDIAPVITLSAESLAALQAKYPDQNIAHPDTAVSIPVEITEASEETLSVPIEVNETTITAKVGETGKFTLKDFGDIQLTGTFAEITDNDYIKVDKDGSWKALKSGETEITPVATLTKESADALQKANPDKKIIHPDMATVVKVKITQELSVPLNIKPTKIDTTVGATGKLELEEYEGVKLTGTFTAIENNDYIEVASDGTWKALKTGETTIAPVVKLSKESLEALEKKFPDREIVHPERGQEITVKISAAATGTNTGTESNAKKYPATNDTRSNWTAVGLFLVGACGALYVLKRKKSNI